MLDRLQPLGVEAALAALTNQEHEQFEKKGVNSRMLLRQRATRLLVRIANMMLSILIIGWWRANLSGAGMKNLAEFKRSRRLWQKLSQGRPRCSALTIAIG